MARSGVVAGAALLDEWQSDGLVVVVVVETDKLLLFALLAAALDFNSLSVVMLSTESVVFTVITNGEVG